MRAAELTGPVPSFAERLDERPVARVLRDAVVPIRVVTVDDKNLALRVSDYVARRGEVIGVASGNPGLTERHEQLAAGGELEDLVAEDPARGGLTAPGLRHPDVPVGVHVQPMGPLEHPGPELGHHVPVRVEPDDRMQVGIVTIGLAAAGGPIVSAPHDRPEVLAIPVDM